MAWTKNELDQVRAAVMALATGARAVSVSYAGPPARTVSYGTVQLPELRALLADMERSQGDSPTYRLASTRKGL